MADKQKYFDLHLECGMTDTGTFYVKTILGKRGIEYRDESITSLACRRNLST